MYYVSECTDRQADRERERERGILFSHSKHGVTVGNLAFKDPVRTAQ